MPWTGLSERVKRRDMAHWPKLSPWASLSLCAAVFAVATLVAQWLSLAYGGAVFVRSTYGAGAWWQLLTSQWVHFGYLHALANAAAMAVVLIVLQGWVDGRLQCLAMLGGYGGVAAVLALDSHCTVYAGASGALHGMLAGSAFNLLLRGQPAVPVPLRRGQILGAALLMGLGAKLLAQHLMASPSEPGWLGIATYYPAHEAGALGGLVAAWLARGLLHGRRARPDAEQQ